MEGQRLNVAFRMLLGMRRSPHQGAKGYLFVSEKRESLHLPLSAGKRNIDFPFPHEPLHPHLFPPVCHDITKAVVKPTTSDGLGFGSPTVVQRPCVQIYIYTLLLSPEIGYKHEHAHPLVTRTHWDIHSCACTRIDCSWLKATVSQYLCIGKSGEWLDADYADHLLSFSVFQST